MEKQIQIIFEKETKIAGVILNFGENEGSYSYEIIQKEHFLENEKLRYRHSVGHQTLFLVDSLEIIISQLEHYLHETVIITGFKKRDHDFRERIYFVPANTTIKKSSINQFNYVYEEVTSCKDKP